MGDELNLIIEGSKFGSWKDVRFRKSLDELAHAFEVDFTEAWLPNGEPIPVREGDSCIVRVDDKSVTTGYVDDFGTSYAPEEHTLTVAGRSKTADLVDCSTELSKSQQLGKTYLEIAKKICEPYEIEVEAANGVDLSIRPFKAFQAPPGTRCIEALDEIAQKVGGFLQTTPEGNLVFTRASTTRIATELRYGENIKRGRFSASLRDRYSVYEFTGATRADDDWNGEKASSVRAKVEDPDVERTRRLVVVGERDSHEADLKTRATLERNIRAGRSERLTYVVQGWSHKEGIWEPNTLVHVNDVFLRFEADMLIRSVELSKNNDDGTITTLELVGKEAYDVLEPPPRRKSRTKALPPGLALAFLNKHPSHLR